MVHREMREGKGLVRKERKTLFFSYPSPLFLSQPPSYSLGHILVSTQASYWFESNMVLA